MKLCDPIPLVFPLTYNHQSELRSACEIELRPTCAHLGECFCTPHLHIPVDMMLKIKEVYHAPVDHVISNFSSLASDKAGLPPHFLSLTPNFALLV